MATNLTWDYPLSSAAGEDNWREELTARVPAVAKLLAVPVSVQIERGYFHTLREICQQPLAWVETAEGAVACGDALAGAVRGSAGDPAAAVVLTGSGSSEYVAECLTLPLQDALQVPVVCVGGGRLLTGGRRALPPCRPGLAVSFARSGNSPESCAVVDLLLEKDPAYRHLLVTCNRAGQLATRYRGHPAVTTLTLADRTCDRSLVMTSSFTNMALAGLSLAYFGRDSDYLRLAGTLAASARSLMLSATQGLAELATRPFASATFLGSGSSFGAARESALKLVEITGGRVRTFAETYLGLRHGPLSAVHKDTLLVCFLASDPLVRAYELDLIAELNRKELGLAKVIAGASVPRELLSPPDVAVECPGMAAAGDDAAALLHLLAGQWIAFFRGLAEGLQPDSPSPDGTINRVVESFRIHHGP